MLPHCNTPGVSDGRVYGAISVDQGKHRLFAGPVEAGGGKVTISGVIADRTYECETARTYDPLQIASLLSENDVSRDEEWQLGRDGPCVFAYDLRWQINVPPRKAP